MYTITTCLHGAKRGCGRTFGSATVEATARWQGPQLVIETELPRDRRDDDHLVDRADDAAAADAGGAGARHAGNGPIPGEAGVQPHGLRELSLSITFFVGTMRPAYGTVLLYPALKLNGRR